MSKYPSSAKRIIEFRPNTEAVTLAEKRLADADASGTGVEAAQAALDAALARQSVSDPVYRLRNPTPATMADVQYYTMASGARSNTNADLIAALEAAADDGRIYGADADFVAEAATAFKASGAMPDGAWGRISDIALSTPGEAGDRGPADLIALRVRRNEIEAQNLIRLHLILDGERSPLSTDALVDIPVLDRIAIAGKVIELTAPTADESRD